jgi:isopenicillin-N N-acyltransferase-like protein
MRPYLAAMGTIRVLELRGTDPSAWGAQHGESFRDDIQEIADIRMELTLARTDLGSRAHVLALARHHLPLLERFDGALFAELNGIAKGAGLAPEEIVVVNHYTDLRDLGLKDLSRLNGDIDGCSAVFVAPGQARILAQTWDMHGTAEPFALLIKVQALPDGSPVGNVSPAGIPKRGSTVVFSITGCLGMTGLSSWGTALTINNLNSTDATVGVVWPALVRKALRQPSAAAMRELILQAPIGSGRHFIVADDKEVIGIETSGTKKKVIREGASDPYFHTNHSVDDEMAATCRILPGSTTLQRYATLREITKGPLPSDMKGAFEALEPTGLPHSSTNPHDVATCGAIAMDIKARNVMAATGIPGPDADAIVVEVR